MTVKSARADLPQMVGFTWVLELETYDYGGGGEHSEVTYVSLSPTSANGGTYFIQHIEEDGRWFAFEMGGAGPMVWEREIAHGVTFPSPIAAMLAVKREHNREIKMQIEAEKELDRFFERQRLRARGREKIEGVG